MARIARVCAIDHPHHITQRGNNRQPVFFRDEDRLFYLETLGYYSLKYELHIWAYCLMPNHVHLLGVPQKEESLARGVGSTNLVYTQYVNRKYERSGRLWQNRFFSAVVDTDNYLLAVIKYVENNSVRAGMTSTAEEYRWSSAAGENEMVKRPEWLHSQVQDMQLSKTAEDTCSYEEIRKHTSSGRPLGTESFVTELEKFLGRCLRTQKRGRRFKRDVLRSGGKRKRN